MQSREMSAVRPQNNLTFMANWQTLLRIELEPFSPEISCYILQRQLKGFSMIMNDEIVGRLLEMPKFM
jgi:hypothetical protein